MARALIEFQKVSKNFGSRVVLQNLSLRVYDGEFVTVVGNQGCGKTTLLKLLNGLLAPDSGRIRLQGKEISQIDQTELRRSVGYVIQGVGLFPHMNIKNNIAYVLNLLGEEKYFVDRRVNELSDIVGLDRQILSYYPKDLVSGQKQRVGIARALAANQHILLMDDPFGAVDEMTRRSLQDEIRNIHRMTGVTILFITRDVKEALKLGSRVMVMNQGRIDQIDSPSTLLANPKTDFVRKLVAV